MREIEHTMKSTSEHAAELLEKINIGEIATESECNLMISDLKNLQQYNIKQTMSKDEVQMDVNIENQLSAFKMHADSSRQLLNDMLSAITEGRVPEKQQIQELNTSVDDLRQQYNLIYETARKECSDEELPEMGSSVYKCVDALKNSKAITYRKQIDAAKECLESFIAVKSLADLYAQQLSPYQKKAKELLEKICDGDFVEVTAVEEETEGPKVFLKALESENPATDDNGMTIQHISQIYAEAPLVIAGIASKQYYIDANSENSSESKKCTEGTKTKEETENKPLTRVVQPTDEDEQHDKANNNTKTSDFVQQLIANKGFIVPSDVGELVVDKQPSEDKKITATIFTNDIRKTNIAAAKIIVSAIVGTQFVNRHYLISVAKVPENVAIATLEYFYKHGYLRRYSLSTGGMYYCESPKLVKALSYKDASKFVSCAKRSAEEWGESIEDKALSAATRIAFSEVYTDIMARFVAVDIKRHREAISTFRESFVMNVHTAAAQKDCEFAIGAFWEDSSECDTLIETFNQQISDCNGIASITFAGYTKHLAQVFADAFVSAVDLSAQMPVMYLYASSERQYYTYPKLDAINTSDIHYTSFDVDDGVGKADENTENKTTETDVTIDTNELELPTSVEVPIADAGESEESATESHIEKPTNNVDASECISNLYDTIQSGKFYAATAYAKAYAMENPALSGDYMRLAYAINDPMAHCDYSSANVFTLIANQNVYNDSLIIATAMRTFFSNQNRYDYDIKSFFNAIKGYQLLDNFPALSKVVYTLMDFKDTHKKGLDAYADYRAKSKAELETTLTKLRQDAKDFYESFITARKTESGAMKRFIETKRLIFSANGDIGTYIKVVCDNDTTVLSLVQEFLQNKFFKEGNNLSEDTIDSDMLWNYICVFWEKAGDNMILKKHLPLVSSLKNNVISTVTKAVQLLVRWCNICETITSGIEDEGATAYKKLRKPLLTYIADARAEIETQLKSAQASGDEKTGLSIVRYALNEIGACIEGEYDERTREYFYAPFLLTDDIILDEQFIPDFDVHGSTLKALQPTNRILEHLSNLAMTDASYTKRMTEIMEQQGDDFGTAALIAEFMAYKDSSFNIKEVNEDIEASKAYAHETADLRKEDFIGELELAQSYGQIDNSVEKEQILQIVNLWYEWAVNCSNYGFFKKVLDSYLAAIKESAKSRESDFFEQLQKFQELTIPGMTTAVKEKRISTIRSMISKQNYTVAEDLLARATNMDDEHGVFVGDDFLKEFLDNYDDYYRPVAYQQSSFASLVSKRTRNKEERGAKKLADNWLPGGSNIGKERLANLLDCLGFKIASISEQTLIGKFENYNVIALPERDSQGISCAHPIAAFGSGAVTNGFRVLCINGVYEAEALIDVMKKIGNAKHTLVLLDCALQKSERRKLARKSKNELGDKLFGVVDRVTMMFMVRNYDATKINRMLVSIITPFGYYQPYVWESANVMPPEIFMGRKRELEKIKSATGVNIVYGGRQLGKSALLKKAKEDIDHDENGDRAIYIEIKGMTYENACRKIGHELYDQGILNQDIDTSDWNELARAIKRRLQATENFIPYLLLLLDEADAFIDSCESVNYRPFDALKDIQGVGTERFKFVIAGLRNIVRFKREAALGNNSVLTHLQSMTVMPFNTSEARELMEIPLHYLGLVFPAEKESLITLILATTNYFPGMIQLYCAKLLEAMRNKDYAGYDEVDTPIYEVSEEHIKKVLADPEFMQQIREKFIITLKLDEDNYYYLIALLMAYLCHSKGYNSGYSAVDIKNAGAELEILKIMQLDDNKLAAFMEELMELNVLRKTDDVHYLFTRFTFFQMMGTANEVENSLVEFMGE